jgi:hypothetical protein
MSEELETRSVGFLERKLALAWEQLAPLSAGAVVSSAAIVAGRGLLRRLLGSKRGGLTWASTVALIPFGLLLLAAAREVRERPASADEAPESEDKETIIIPEE